MANVRQGAEADRVRSPSSVAWACVVQMVHAGPATMVAVAERMGCSRDTHYRPLKDEGVSFANVLGELRHQLASAHVRGGKASVNEIAYLVGLSDPASFSRAFKNVSREERLRAGTASWQKRGNLQSVPLTQHGL